MTGSTMPLEAHLGGHPVHRATALLREALYSSAALTPDPAEIWATPIYRLDPAPLDLDHGPVGMTDPDALTALLGFAPFEGPAPECQSSVTDTADGGAAQAPLQAPLEDAAEGEDVLDRAVQLQLRGLVEAFHQRQRQANLVVACSIAVALILTLGGLILLFSMIGPAPTSREDAGSKGARAPDRHAEILIPRPTASPAPIAVSTSAANEAEASVIETRPGRPLALGALLPLGSASYILLRGLPEDAELSAGRQTGPGTWMVKDTDVVKLTLILGENANGDYPTEVYLLGPEQGLQARRRLILRVDTSPQIYAAGLALGWPTAFLDTEAAPEPAHAPAAPVETAAVYDRAQHLLADGEIAGARRLLEELAEGGETDAAYELALTYDDEVLVKAGLRDIDGDAAIAETWYTRAATNGHAAAARRLNTLVRRRADV
ncbi:MAG TPA: hypothetical protein VMW68_07835 [Methyloceanibacter sp.]|nr:hypothetical protein [Methyloceanibacter sp.]